MSEEALQDEVQAQPATEEQAPEGTLLGQEQSEEQTPEGGTLLSRDESEEGTGERAPEGAPEQYEEFTLGEDVKFTDEGLNDLKSVFKELNLSQDSAQKIVDKFATAQVAVNKDVVLASAKRWAEETRNDPEIGGANFKQNLGVASKAYRQFASPKLQAVFEESGLGNHPEVVRLFVKLGNEMAQDKGVRGEGSEPAHRSRSLYPKSNMIKA